MKGSLTFGVDVPTQQKLTATRDSCAKWLASDPDIKVISTNSAMDERPFTVVGSIKGRPDESWREVFTATDAADAKAQALKVDAKRTIVSVFAGELQAVA